MRTSNQVAVYCAFKDKNKYSYIFLKRTSIRGGFWQPITGGEESFDDKDLFRTAIREAKEELNINIHKTQIHKIPYSFSFIDKNKNEKKEQCFGVILSQKQKEKISISNEHTGIIYSSDIKYLNSLLKFKENKIGLNKFNKWIRENY